MINVRAETTADAAAIAQVHTLAFGQPNEAQLVAAIRQSEQYVPELSLVAEQAGGIVGHILFSQVSLVGEQTRSILCLAPLAVHPDWQRQGIGTALTEAGLAIADTLMAPLVVVLGHPAYYPRFGFEPSAAWGIQQPFSVPEDASMIKRLSHYSDAYRGTIHYPPSFAVV